MTRADFVAMARAIAVMFIVLSAMVILGLAAS